MWGSFCNFAVAMNNPFYYSPDADCSAAFRELMAYIEQLKGSPEPEDVGFLRELEAGKMLGVLVASDASGVRHTLYAFSGQLSDGGFRHRGFVGPVFDYLQPEGHFKRGEREISRQTAVIQEFEAGRFADVRSRYELAKEEAGRVVAEYGEVCRQSKLSRKARREAGDLTEAELAVMVRQSQYEKAELHRLKKRMDAGLAPLAAALQDARARLDAMREKRRKDSAALQDWLFANFKVLNARGESRSLRDIFCDTPMRIPPSGAGECCAPKLLQAAYRQGLRPESMAEYWYGRPKDGEVRIHGEHYPACRGKCLPVLSWMLQGLEVEPPLDGADGPSAAHAPEIVYENRWFCIVHKPSGMLTVPGKGSVPSLQKWLEEKYGDSAQVRTAHRLDQDTSGLVAATFGPSAFKVMQSLFARREVKKTYVAELEGDYQALGLPGRGRIELPLAPDWLDRPRQRIDRIGGKEAVTDYEFTGVRDGRSRILFYPHTGRTHQLRVHAASAEGLGLPIVGDRLYGLHAVDRTSGLHADDCPMRLRLHARKLEFTFPIDGQRYSFESPEPF